MLRQNVELKHLGFNPTAALLGTNHIFKALIFLLEEYLCIVYFFFFDERGECAVKVWFWTLIDQTFIAAVIFEYQQNFMIAVHRVKNVYAVFLFVQQFLQIFAGSFLHNGLV